MEGLPLLTDLRSADSLRRARRRLKAQLLLRLNNLMRHMLTEDWRDMNEENNKQEVRSLHII